MEYQEIVKEHQIKFIEYQEAILERQAFYGMLKKLLWNAKKLCHEEAIVDIKVL